MSDVFVGSVMSSPVHTVLPETSLRDAGHTMLEHGIGSVVVTDGDRLAGILTATDFVGTVAAGGAGPAESVEASMSTDLTTTTAGESIGKVADLMLECGFHHLPVVDDGELVGMVTTTDLTAYLSD